MDIIAYWKNLRELYSDGEFEPSCAPDESVITFGEAAVVEILRLRLALVESEREIMKSRISQMPPKRYRVGGTFWVNYEP